MIANNESACPICGGGLKYHGRVPRIVRIKGGNIKWILIRRLICIDCGMVHRELPNFLIPYKQYEANIINGMIDGTITCYDLDYEDYPCAMTIQRWKK